MVSLRSCAVLAFAIVPALAEPVPVRHLQGFVHGFLVVRDTNDKILGSGEIQQIPKGSRVTLTMALQFRDGSRYEETSVYSQKATYELLSYRLIEKGPSFKVPTTLSLDRADGRVTITYVEKGKEKTQTEQIKIPDDLVNGILPLMISEASPKSELDLSMLVSTPKARIVKLKVVPEGQDTFSIGGSLSSATRYSVKVELGPVTETVAKVVGKEPPPTYVWVSAGSAGVFLKSEGALFEDGPIWRIELASPSWPVTKSQAGR
jgi:hypothetical protein